jgi:hypothetical protein
MSVDFRRDPRADEAERDVVEVGSQHDPKERSADELASMALAVSDSYVQRSTQGDAPEGLAVRGSALDQASRSGRAMEPEVQGRMEAGFGADLSGVRVHDGGEADQIAQGIGARAFTTGRDIYFAEGQYAPGTAEGDHVLAHELAHTVQDGAGAAHRFPASVLSAPINWAQLGGNVFRPGEGISGGVYIISSTDPNGAVKKVVVKPVFAANGLGSESPEQLAFGDLALARLFGIRAPKSRMVKRGSEFAQLTTLCKPKQPAKGGPEDTHWAPLEDALGFVVMAEVPNPKSIASLAEKAGTDAQAGLDLSRTMFSHVFLSDLGRLCVADIILGNEDRLVFGKVNLGNVMVALDQAGGTLHAIDTAVRLPRIARPNEVQVKGGEGGGGWNNAKTHFDQGPGPVLDDFFKFAIARLKNHTEAVGPDDPPPLWQVMEAQYNNGRAQYLSSFDFGWTNAMLDALVLSGNQHEVEEAREGHEQEDVGMGALMANLEYAGQRSLGASHEDAVGRTMAITVVNFGQEADRTRLQPSVSDELGLGRVHVPDKSALTAEYSPIPGLPSPGQLNQLVPSKGRIALDPDAYNNLLGMPQRVALAHGQVDTVTGGTKSRGLPGKKKVLPRNRSLLGHFVVDSAAAAAGADRLVDSMAYTVSIQNQLAHASAAKFTQPEATKVASFMSLVAEAQNRLLTNANAYKAQAATAATALARTNVPAKDKYGSQLTTAAQAIDLGSTALANAIGKQDLKTAAAMLRRKKFDA